MRRRSRRSARAQSSCRLGDLERERLLDEDVLARLERLLAKA